MFASHIIQLVGSIPNSQQSTIKCTHTPVISCFLTWLDYFDISSIKPSSWNYAHHINKLAHHLAASWPARVVLHPPCFMLQALFSWPISGAGHLNSCQGRNWRYADWMDPIGSFWLVLATGLLYQMGVSMNGRSPKWIKMVGLYCKLLVGTDFLGPSISGNLQIMMVLQATCRVFTVLTFGREYLLDRFF